MSTDAWLEHHTALAALGPVEPLSPVQYHDALSASMASQVAVEVGVGVEALLRGLTEQDPQVLEAFAEQYPAQAELMSLTEKLAELTERGSGSVDGLVHGIRGKLFELKLPEILQDLHPGSTWSLAGSATQAGWDLQGTLVDGTEVLLQAKARGASAAPDVIEAMEATGAPSLFALTRALAAEVVRLRPDLAGRVEQIDLSTLALDEQIDAVFGSLAVQLGVDVPEAVTDLIPIVGEVILGLRMLLDIAQNERALESMPRGDKNRMHAVRAAALLTRFSVSALCATGGGAIGAAAASVVPGAGTAVGSLGGTVAGVVLAAKINRDVQPRLLELGMRAAAVSMDDVFYYQNRAVIDDVGTALRGQADRVGRPR